MVDVTPAVEVERPTKQALPEPAPIEQVEVVWVVLTEETLAEHAAEPGWAFIALTPKQYENLSRNTAETLRWVTEAYEQLEYYRDE